MQILSSPLNHQSQQVSSAVENKAPPSERDLQEPLGKKSQTTSTTIPYIINSSQGTIPLPTDLLPGLLGISLGDQISPKKTEIETYSPSDYLFSKLNHGISSNPQQDDYVLRVHNLKLAAVARIKQAVEKKRDLIEVFYEELEVYGRIRNEIAVDQKDENARFFGIRCDSTASYDVINMTELNGQYCSYHNILMPIISKNLSTMDHSLREFKEKELKIAYAPVMNRKSSMEISIIDDVVKQLSLLTTEEMEFYNGNKNIEDLRKLKKTSPEKYKELKLKIAIVHMRSQYPTVKKSDWVLITRRLEVDGKMYALSQYLTWMFRDFKIDPIVRMEMESVIGIIHQDVFLIETMLKDTANLFKNFILLDSRDSHELKKQIVLFVYEFANAMPFKRGSAAIGEWLQIILLCYHGYDITFSQKTSIDLDAQTLSLEEFSKRYLEIVKLKKIAEGS